MFSNWQWERIIRATLKRTELRNLEWVDEGTEEAPVYVAKLSDNRFVIVRSADDDDQAPFLIGLRTVNEQGADRLYEINSIELSDGYEPFQAAHDLYFAIQRQVTGVDAEFEDIMDVLDPEEESPF